MKIKQLSVQTLVMLRSPSHLQKNEQLHLCPFSQRKSNGRVSGGLEDFVMQTSGKDKSVIDHQLAKIIYATNCPFLLVEHNEFIKLMSMFRPGYKPPKSYDISGRLLDEVHTSMLADCKDQLGVETVSMALDGWSSVHNEPVLCVC